MPRLSLPLFALMALLLFFTPVAAWDYTSLASMATDGTPGNGDSSSFFLSGNGRYIAFESDATDLVTGDTNGVTDVFVHDLVTRQTIRVSVATSGTQGNDRSFSPSISANGRYITFTSHSTNLVVPDANGIDQDIYLHDRVLGQTSRVSVSSGGAQGNSRSILSSLSGDGRNVAFVSYATNLVAGDTNSDMDVFVRDLIAGLTTRVSVNTNGTEANGYSTHPSISATGRYVAFESPATTLVSGDTNGHADIFVHDNVAGWTTRVSFSQSGEQSNAAAYSPAISGDGRYVAYNSWATNLVDGDTNGASDVFLYDRFTPAVTRVSLANDGSQGNGDSEYPSLSSDGSLVAFQSGAGNLVAGDTNGATDAFLRNWVSGTTARLSVATGGVQGNGDSYVPGISDNGQHTAFYSTSTNFAPGTDGVSLQVYMHSYPLRFFAVFRPSAYDNWIYSMDLATVMVRNHYGGGTDRPLVAELNDDGFMDRAVFRNGEWIMDYSLDGTVNWRPLWGMAGDLPLAGYISSDRIADWGVFRSGQWIVDYLMDGSINSRTWYGMAGDIPLVADFNNDGNPDRAVFRRGEWIVDYSRDGSVNSRSWYGMAGDIPLAADFNCDGVTDRAVFRNGDWIFDYSLDGSVDWRPSFGMAGDIPLMWWQV